MEETDVLNKQEPNLFEKPEKQPKQKKKSKTKRIVLLVILGVIFLALLGGGIYAWHVFKRPGLFFESFTRIETTQTPAPTPMIEIEKYLPTADPDATPLPVFVPTATPVRQDPEIQETPQPSNSDSFSGIVNIALFGIDAYENGRSTSGTMPHTDANLILAINFDTNEISMISIARDCLTKAPGYSGYYKFNGVFNVGGGMKDPDAGFALSCRAAEEWLGGVSVPYYYGVDFQALIDLVDMIGGIDFQVEITLRTLDGRTIGPGYRHLDGQGVMAYMRMRRTADWLDSSRTARQRKMLVAIFKKLKQEGKLSMVPGILKTMGDNVYTNTTLAQTTALVNFANGIDPDSIRTYSIQGTMKCNYTWRFCFIDQQARMDILKEVYGIDAAPMGMDTAAYEKFLYQSGFRAIQYLNITKKLFAKVHEIADADSMSEEQKEAYAVCWNAYQELQQMFDYVDQWTQAHYDDNVALTEQEKKDRETYYAALTNLEENVKKAANALNEAFGKPISPRWNRKVSEWFGEDSDINEVYVDFN